MKRFEDAKSLMLMARPVAQRVLGSSHINTLRMNWHFARALYLNKRATLDDLREAVETLEETERTARQVLGGAHPLTTGIANSLQIARAILGARESGIEVKINR